MESKAGAELAVHETLQYQGRKATRAKSEQRRRDILEATLRIIRTEGVRGVRHRAVAKEAKVPLAATTYYFKDIDELIVDAFTLYTEQALLVLRGFTGNFYQPLSQLLSAGMSGPAERERLIEFMAEQVTQYMRVQIIEEYDMLTIEQAFRYEALVNQKVRGLGQIHRSALYEIAVEFFEEIIRSKQPKADAEILIGLFHAIEYKALLGGLDNLDMDGVRTTLKHYIGLMVNNLATED